MKYNIEKSVLTTDTGELIKHLNCPINKRWENLVPLATTHLKRRCNECHKNVIDISVFSDEQVVAIVETDPKACLYVRSDASNIEFVGGNTPERHKLCILQDGRYEYCRIIRTARSLDEINSYYKEPNYRLLVEIVEENPNIREKIEIAQDPDTGKVILNGDYRGMTDPGDAVWYHPRRYTSPIAAYLVPDDIKIGERVYMPDLIEEYVGERQNQSDTYKLEYAFAVWNGEAFDVEVHEPGMMIG